MSETETKTMDEAHTEALLASSDLANAHLRNRIRFLEGKARQVESLTADLAAMRERAEAAENSLAGKMACGPLFQTHPMTLMFDGKNRSLEEMIRIANELKARAVPDGAKVFVPVLDIDGKHVERPPRVGECIELDGNVTVWTAGRMTHLNHKIYVPWHPPESPTNTSEIPNSSTTAPAPASPSAESPSREWLEKMAAAEDAAGCVSVGGMVATLSAAAEAPSDWEAELRNKWKSFKSKWFASGPVCDDMVSFIRKHVLPTPSPSAEAPSDSEPYEFPPDPDAGTLASELSRIADSIGRSDCTRKWAEKFIYSIVDELPPAIASHVMRPPAPSVPPVAGNGTKYAPDITEEMQAIVDENCKAVAGKQSEGSGAKQVGVIDTSNQTICVACTKDDLAWMNQRPFVEEAIEGLKTNLETFRRDHEAMEAIRKHGLDVLRGPNEAQNFSARRWAINNELISTERYYSDPADAVFDLVKKLEGGKS